MALTFTIGGVNRTNKIKIDSVRLSMGYRSTWTLTITSIDRLSTSSAYRPAINDTILVTDGATDIFRGWIFGVTDTPIVGPQKGTMVTIACRSTLALFDSTIIDKVYGTDPLGIANSSVANPSSITTVQPHGYVTGQRVLIEDHVGSSVAVNGVHVVTVTSHSTFTIPVNNTTSGGGGTVRQITPANLIVSDLYTTYLAPIAGFSIDTLSTAPDMMKCVWKGVPLRQAMDDLMTATGWIARVTPAGQVQFFAPGVKTAPYSLTAANQLSVGPVTWQQNRQQFVDVVRLNFGSDSVIPKTDTITGDGATNVWALKYHPAVDANGLIVSSGYVADTGLYSPLGLLSDIATSSVANPSVITTVQPHGLEAGASISVVIQSHSGSTPSINGTHTATVTGLRTFTIPVNVTVAGTGGSVYQANLVWLYYPTTNSLFRVGALASESLATFTYSAQFPDFVTAGSGIWQGVYAAPTVFDVGMAQQMADGILRKQTATPKAVTVATRQSAGPPMPGDTITLTYTDRTISGAHLIQAVEGAADADKVIRYTITAMTGTEFQDTALDIQRDVLTGGGSSSSGTVISGGAIIGGPSGVVSGRIQGERVVIEKPATVHLEFHPLEVPDPDPTERRYIDMEVHANRWAVYDRTQQGADAYVDIGVMYYSRTTGEGYFAGHGIATDVAYSGGNFTASAGSWTVDSGDQNTFRYASVAYKTMRVNFAIRNTDVSATPLTLRITIPNGKTAAEEARAMISVVDAGGAPAVGMALVAVGDTHIYIYKDVSGTSNWSSTSGDNTSVVGAIVFEYQ